jgi:hypothetical protein
LTAAEIDVLEFRQMLRESDNASEHIRVRCCKQVTTSQDDVRHLWIKTAQSLCVAAVFPRFCRWLFCWSIRLIEVIGKTRVPRRSFLDGAGEGPRMTNSGACSTLKSVTRGNCQRA